MKYTSATLFDICQMTNRTDHYNNWTTGEYGFFIPGVLTNQKML
jgi:hypothetical protein